MDDSRALVITEDERRPYAPAANVLAVIERVRRLNLPQSVDTDFLRLADVPEGSLGRVAFALRFLGLTDANARPTDQLRAIARATEDEYRELLAGVVQAAYAVDFARVNPAEETQTKIVSAFQRYEPRSQTTRMVMLFLGLAKAAGIPVMEAPRDRANQAARPTARVTVRNKPSARPQAQGSMPLIAQREQRPSTDLLFGVTVEDIAVLPEADFASVWEALGKVARARARAALRREEPPPDEGDGE
jgi:hypothetical protein